MTVARKAVFHVDASVEIGGGHVHRCLSLADAMREFGWSCQFVTVSDSLSVVPGLTRHSVCEIADPSPSATHRLDLADDCELAIIDHYGLDAAFERACRKSAQRVMVIEDVPGRKHCCDILLDQTLGRDSAEYGDVVAISETRLLLGTEFALLRPEFAALRASMRRLNVRKALHRLLISFGATDPWGLCLPAAETALQAQVRHIDLAVGPSCPHIDGLRALSRSTTRLNLHVNADMAALVSSADLAIGAGGSSSWERCCLGLPSIVVVAADNQREIAAKLERAQVSMCVDATVLRDRATMVPMLDVFLSAPTRLSDMSERAFMQCDGLGATRVAAALTSL